MKKNKAVISLTLVLCSPFHQAIFGALPRELPAHPCAPVLHFHREHRKPIIAQHMNSLKQEETHEIVEYTCMPRRRTSSAPEVLHTQQVLTPAPIKQPVVRTISIEQARRLLRRTARKYQKALTTKLPEHKLHVTIHVLDKYDDLVSYHLQTLLQSHDAEFDAEFSTWSIQLLKKIAYELQVLLKQSTRYPLIMPDIYAVKKLREQIMITLPILKAYVPSNVISSFEPAINYFVHMLELLHVSESSID